MAVVATLTKGYDLEYIWKQVDRGPAKDAASYYIQASEAGGEPPGRWWGPGAKALGFERGQRVEREPYDLLFGERQAPDGTQLGRHPDNGRKAADLYAQLLAAEPHATAERKRELRTEAVKKARQSPLFFDLTLSLSKSISIFHASLGENARLARRAGGKDGARVLVHAALGIPVHTDLDHLEISRRQGLILIESPEPLPITEDVSLQLSTGGIPVPVIILTDGSENRAILVTQKPDFTSGDYRIDWTLATYPLLLRGAGRGQPPDCHRRHPVHAVASIATGIQKFAAEL